MKIYLASSFLNKKVAKDAMTMLEKAGHEITMDWTAHQHTNELGTLETQSVEDMKGVRECTALIYLHPGRNGSNAELGAAIAFEKYIIMVGGVPRHESVYYNYPGIIHVADMDAALEAVEDLARKNYIVE